jgi:exodeoxyribonuclease V beta subunit
VDLVFRYEERFFLVDWKSNDLGPTREHYAPERLRRAMVDGLYHVQAFLYTLALDRYLALRLPGYRYDLHFGGAYYVFLRGADPETGPGSGVHRVRPSMPLMEDLRKVLISETVGPGPKEPRS